MTVNQNHAAVAWCFCKVICTARSLLLELPVVVTENLKDLDYAPLYAVRRALQALYEFFLKRGESPVLKNITPYKIIN